MSALIRRCFVPVLPVLFALLSARAGEAPPPLTPAALAAAGAAVESSLVRVEYVLRYDNGELPESGGWRERCPGCGRYHGTRGDRFIREERPLETSGFLVAPQQVLTRDTMIHPRFVEAIRVRFGEAVVEAQIESHAADQCAVLLRLDAALPGTEPLSFVATRQAAPLLTLEYVRQNGFWQTAVKPLAGTVFSVEGQPGFREVPGFSLILDREGRAVAASMRDELPLDDSWQGLPLDWTWIPAAEMQGRIDALRTAVDEGIVRVTLNFRSPRSAPGTGSPFGRSQRYGGDEDEDATERNGVGLMLEGGRILVLEQLTPPLTARLERIQVHRADGSVGAAHFLGSLKDFGAFVASLEEPGVALVHDTAPPQMLRNKLLLSAEVRVQGTERTVHLQHRRMAGFDVGRWNDVFPELPGESRHHFLFTLDGALTILPVRQREPLAPQERWRRDADPIPMFIARIAGACADLAAHVDSNNVPLSPEEENRLAWLGVELQELDRELARANNLSALTRDGAFGAIVSYVYSGSPAAGAGIDVGDILLRLHLDDLPQPFEVRIDEDHFRSRPFPWEQMDQIPEQYFDQIPSPWQPAETQFSRALTNFGIGKAYQAEFSIGGEIVRKDFEIVQSPPHFAVAEQFRSDVLGVTVRALTYEVRRYLQLAPEEAGVVVSRIEPGSRASVAGLKPYEIITRINDEDVKSPADFERLVANGEMLRMNVQRMRQSRVLQIRMDVPVQAPAEALEIGDDQ